MSRHRICDLPPRERLEAARAARARTYARYLKGDATAECLAGWDAWIAELEAARTDTAFQVGDRVTSTVDAQGLRIGRQYLVEAVTEAPTPFGTFVTYTVRGVGTGDATEVRNGHLLLRRV